MSVIEKLEQCWGRAANHARRRARCIRPCVDRDVQHIRRAGRTIVDAFRTGSDLVHNIAGLSVGPNTLRPAIVRSHLSGSASTYARPSR